MNRYSYVEGNPVSYLDPFGLEKFVSSKVISYIHTIIDIFSFIISGAGLLVLIAPEIATVLGIILLALNIAVTIIEIKESGEDEKLIKEAIAQLVINVILLATGPIGNIISEFKFIYDYQYGF